MDVAIDGNGSIVQDARKNMRAIYSEITQLLCVGSMDDIRAFMAKIAQEGGIPCEDCQNVEWTALGVGQRAQ